MRNYLAIKNTNSARQEGFMALVSLLLISSVILAIAVSISLLGVGEAKSALDFKKGQETLKIAEGCIEEALLRLKRDGSYSGGTLLVGDGLCTIIVIGVEPEKEIEIEARISGSLSYVKRIVAEVVVSGSGVTITNWQEVP